jgi:single-strand selective monofunctional uracil DNA glycosylase
MSAAHTGIAHRLGEAASRLVGHLEPLRFGGEVACVYNPLVYARAGHDAYMQRFADSPKRVLFLGMNPGPHGMAQTGVPFGEVDAVKNWMGIAVAVSQPDPAHPQRPVEGFACQRSEVSGRRLWGLFAERFGQAENFFAEHIVVNYCPLVWMAASGRNLTPDKLPASEMAAVDRACQAHLVEVLRVLEPEFLVGVGAYAEAKLATAAAHLPERKLVLGRILHPSPASPAANRGWAAVATRQLIELGVWPR